VGLEVDVVLLVVPTVVDIEVTGAGDFPLTKVRTMAWDGYDN
jgi:hypothetical protein